MKAEEAKRLELARRHRARVLIATLIVCVVTVYFLCVSLGSVRIALADVWGSLFSGDDWGNRVIVRDIRAPRVLGAAIAGAALSLGGMAMQALFKNPMASPSVLGISSGASFGAAFYIAYGSAIVLSSWGTVASAFGMALMTLLLVYSLAYRRNGGVQTTMLLLAGMATSALFSGLTSMIEFFSDEDTVTSIVFWMLGSFDGCGWHDDLIMLVSLRSRRGC
jgi:iron complex transport system permease protein